MGSRKYGQLYAEGSHTTPSSQESNDMNVSRLARLDGIPWYKKPNLRLLYLLMLPTCIGVEMASGFDASMMNGLQAVSSWLEYYDHPRSAALGIMAAMYSLGCFAGAPFVPLVVDRIGRRYPILFGAVISIIGGILQGSALSFTTFVLARFILGFATVFCVVAASSLIGELAHPNERAVMNCLFTTSYDLGAVGAAAVTLATFAMTSNWGWRIPSLLQIVPSLLQATFIWFLPESPRWLVGRGRGSEAYAILVKYHAEGEESSEFVKAEYNQIEEALEAELRMVRLNRKALFSGPGIRNRVIIASFLGLGTQWSGIGLISHFLSVILDSIGIHDNRTKNIINLARFSWSLLNATFAALINSRHSRRRVYLTSTISLFVIFTAWTVASAEYSFTHSKIAAHAALALIFVFSPAYNLGFTSMISAYLVELFPFHFRVTGLSVYQSFYRGGACFIQFVNPIGIDLAGWRWYIAYCIWDAIQIAVVYFMFPETSGRTLEELTFLLEGEQEAIRQAEAETLYRHGGIDTYGSVQDGHTRGAF